MRIPKTEKLFKRFLLWSFEQIIVLENDRITGPDHINRKETTS